MTSKRSRRELTPAQVLRWATGDVGVMRLRTDRDVLPNGYMAATVPMLVDWRASDLDAADGPVAVLRHVSYGGSPLERTTVLHSIRVPIEGVRAAEFTLVPSTVRAVRAAVHHAQLRFVFDRDRAPELLHLAGADNGTDSRLDDLVLSWESWRPMGTPFDLKAGLDDAAYGLSLRAYAGPQRFLEDQLHGLDWYGYRLQMPGGRRGLVELLAVALTLGDGAARHTLARMVRQSEAEWSSNGPPGSEDWAALAPAWSELLERIVDAPRPDDVPQVDAEQDSYQVLVRSCAALARHAILVAASRMVESGQAGEFDASRLPDAVLEQTEPWMRELAHADLRGVFLRAPTLLRYVLSSPSAIPKSIPDELDGAGLLERERGKPRMFQYGRDAIRPYDSQGAAT